MTETFKNI